MRQYVIIGNGVAGTTAAEYIRRLDKEGTVAILTEEDFPFYWRIRLNEYISGELHEEDLISKKQEWYRDQRIDLKLKTRVVGGSALEKFVVTGEKEKTSFDRLLVATGSHSFVPPIKGSEKKGVLSLRSIRDAREIVECAKKGNSAVLIGGGLLGLEAGNAVRKLGLKVTVVEFFPRLLPRQLDVEGAKRLQTLMEGMGFSFRMGAKTQEIVGDGAAKEVLLEGGEALPADMVIISAGVRPNLELGESLGLEMDKGIRVDEYLRTNQPDIYAAGDVAEYKGVPYGLWTAAMEQGQIAGTNMAGGETKYPGTTMATTLKVVGVDLASAGEIDVDRKFESKVLVGERSYKKIVLDQNHIIGCIMLGDKAGFNQITKLMSDKRDVSQFKEEILSEGFDFGKVK